jgi:uncharacterized membrane protein (TIGR01666 family)
MNYAKKYLNFINGRYAAEGIRITGGIIAPSLLLNAFGHLTIGLVMSFGALCVSVADTPGAVRHRVNGMLATCFLVAVLAVITPLVANNPLLLGALLVVAGFIFSMFTVYGVRSSAVGIAALIIIILSLQAPPHGKDIWVNAGYTLVGGVWYMLYSLILYRLRPYKFIQQVLGDYVSDVSQYLRSRGDFYADHPDYEKVNEALLQKQIKVEHQQNLLSDLFFNTRKIMKESTQTGRVLVKIYLEVAELFESIMTSFQDYRLLHQQFDETGILHDYEQLIFSLSDELEEIALAIKSGNDSQPNNRTKKLLQKTKEHFADLRQNHMDEHRVEHFVSLGRILRNLEDMAEKVKSLHGLSTYEIEVDKEEANAGIYKKFSVDTSMRPSLFINNLNFKSNIFRHALRMALALLAGYIVSLFFKVDRGYWILLTIVVILKPAYSLSKQRNYDRLIGTACGIIAGMLILFTFKNDTLLLLLMILMMVGTYSFMRTNYFLSVLFMTPYLLLFFHLLYPYNLNELIVDRIVDTAIGSGIALVFSLFLVPVWEADAIKDAMVKMVEANDKFYGLVAGSFSSSGSFNTDQIKIARKESMVALANLSDAFTRMLNEPKRFRYGTKEIHQFVVLNHDMASHLATLSYFLVARGNPYRSSDLLAVTKQTRVHFSNAVKVLKEVNADELVPADKTALRHVNDGLALLLEKRREEVAKGNLETPTKRLLVDSKSVIDQFNFVYNDAASILRVINEYNKIMNEQKKGSLLRNPLEILDV